MYKYQLGITGDKIIIKDEPGRRISFIENPESSEYQQYLKWVAQGNVAEEVNN